MSPAQQTPGTPPRRTGAIRAAMGKSSADLRALAAELPANDISRDLALEVARLKDEVDRLTSERHAAAGSNLVKPESGVFKIPMSSANTVVRTAVGSTGNTDISVTMPSRSDNAPDLEVLRPGKVRKTEQVNLSPAQTIEEAGSHSQDGVKEDKLRQVAVVLAILVIVGLISYAVWWALQALAPSSSPPVTLTEAAAGTLRLGQDYKGHPALAKPLLRRGKVEDEANGWTAYIDPHDHVTAVMIPVGPNSPPIKIEFEQYSIAVDAKTSVGGVKEKFGEPVSYAAPTTWNVLRYEGRQGISAIEFVFSSADNGRLAYVRILDLKAMPWLPDPDK